MVLRKHKIIQALVIAVVVFACFKTISDHPREIDAVTEATRTSTREADSEESVDDAWSRRTGPATGRVPRGMARRQLDFVKTIPSVEALPPEHPARAGITESHGWKNRGPYNIGGRTRGLGLDIRNESILLAGGVHGGMWKSEDQGMSWRKTTRPDQLHNVSCLIQDTRPGKEDVWYYGTGEYYGRSDKKGRSLLGDGIYKSVDNGETWELLSSTSSGDPTATDRDFDWVWTLAIDGSNREEDEVYAAATGSIHRSIDGGETWTRVLGDGYASGIFSDVAVTTTGIVYALTSGESDRGGRVWRSVDGLTWKDITPEVWPSYCRRAILEIAPSNENSVYILADLTGSFTGYDNCVPKFWKYSYVSGDGTGAGGLWDDRSDRLPPQLSMAYGYRMMLSVYPDDEDKVIIGGTYVYFSDNGFERDYVDFRWPSGHPLGYHVDHHALVFSSEDPYFGYAAHDGGVSIVLGMPYFPGSTWAPLNYGYVTTQVYALSIVPDRAGDPRIAVGAQDFGTWMTDSHHEDADWDYAYWGDGGFSVLLDGGSKIIATYNDGAIFMTDRGVTGLRVHPEHWTRINPPMENPPFISPLVADPNDDHIIYTSGGRVLWRNSDVTAIPLDGSTHAKSKNWKVISSVDGASKWHKISAIGLSKEPAHVLYFGTTFGELYRIDDAAAPYPKKKVDIYTEKGFPYRDGSYDGYVSSIAVDPHDADHVVVSFSNYGVRSLFATWDGGVSWKDVSGNLEQHTTGRGDGPGVGWIAMLHEQGEITYFAGTTAGLYSTRTLDGLNTVWAQEGSETIGSVDITMIVTREVDGEVVVGTYGNGVYSRDFGCSSARDEPEMPEEFVLHQNHPNPFNPTTTIRFHVPNDLEVNLRVYNVHGQLVKTLIAHRMPAGTHEIVWDGTDESGVRVGSGTYFYRLQAGTYSEIKRMTLVE